MVYRLRYLPLSDVTEGMVLGMPLMLAEHGVINFSLPAGHELTESNIRQIALRHGEFACIQQVDSRTDEERDRDRRIIENRLQHLFRGADLSRPAMAGLYAAVSAYRGL